MSQQPQQREKWTLMFYFASDNPLAPGIVTQLKALKNAGYHPDVNVIAYFDPQPAGAPTHVFDVNAIYKLKEPGKEDIGFNPKDPFVRNLLEDRLWGGELDRNGKKIRDRIRDQAKEKRFTYDLPEAPSLPDENSHSGPTESLQSFLDFCAKTERYKAQHYMLFILGHGLVVGDDVFLFDEHAAKHSVTLSDLGKVLNGFNDEIKETGGKFEFVSFHSCSMSSAEVAFQLQGTANYMLASQGPAFVGSWPYREILIRVFDDVNNGKLKTPYDVKTMLGKIYNYVYANSTDYLLAGYSFDLCLCDLSKDKLKNASAPLEALSKALVAGLENENPLVNYCILLAHWKSQSYFQENYTDLLDFCFCLEGYCNDFSKAVNDGKPFDDIKDACRNAMTVLMPSELEQSKNPVIHADFAGPDSQYSHGLSVFFPWTRPTADREIVKVDDKDKTEYEKYLFNQQTHWFRFLNQYWGPQELVESVKGSTMREPHTDERKPLQDANAPIPQPRAISAEEALREDIVSLMFNAEGPLSNQSALNDGPKTHPPDPTGDECTCGSIKNYKRDTRTRRLRGEKVNKTPVYTMNQKLLQDQNL